MITITQQNPQLFAPALSLEPVFVLDGEETAGTVTVGSIVFNTYESASGHYDYVITGNNADNLSVFSSSVADSIDLTDLPLVKRQSGVDETVTATFTNGRGITDSFRLLFGTAENAEIITTANSVVADTYAEYSFDRMVALFDSLAGPNMFTSGLDRAQTSAIPHAQFTCHAFGGGWANAGGLRFTAVTKRHMIGCWHYGYSVGQTVTFKTAANQIISRTILAQWDPNTYFPGSSISDFQIFLLDSDLPDNTIQPAKVVGEWFADYSEISGGFTILQQSFGLILWNNNGHITPGQTTRHAIQTFTSTPVYNLDGVMVSNRVMEGRAAFGRVNMSGSESLDYSNSANEFFHNVTYGDSGSPCFSPVEGGWAMSGIISGNMWSPEGINAAIVAVDTKAGISTGYTVTVAPDPTL
jgi:hypothetical protein